MAKTTVTPDAELVTPEAVTFRIEGLRRELSSPALPNKVGLLRRIAALKARLGGTGPMKPAIDPCLLVSKGEVERGYSLRVQTI